MFDSGWNVRIDNAPVQMYRADYDFQAVMVPEGEHTVEFVYWPKNLTYALFGSGIGVVIVMVWSLFQMRKYKIL